MSLYDEKKNRLKNHDLKAELSSTLKRQGGFFRVKNK